MHEARRSPHAGRVVAVLRSTPVRLALGLVALFSVVSFTTLGFAYLQIRRSIEDSLNTNLDQQIAGYQIAATPETLVALVSAEAVAVDPEARIVVFLTRGGDSYGNARAEVRGSEVRLYRREGSRGLGEDGYVSRVTPMVGGILVVAESRAPILDLQENFLRLIGFSLIPTLLVSLGAALLIAQASARRVRRIEATLDRLAGGDLTARVSESGRDDDLARIGTGLDRMAEAQETATTTLRQISTDIAHDLKTPVQRLSVLLADLHDRLPADTPEADIAARAMAEADRAVTVFQSLLQIAQIEGGSPKSRFAMTDLAALARTFAEIYEPAAEDTGHMLRLGPLNGPAQVWGDKGLLGQVIANLIENALRHTPAGTMIDLAVLQKAGATVLTLADTGPGIPADETAKVTRRLYRLERSRTTPGNGLGLALVAAIADLHGADLRLEDNRPGLRVSLTFPAAPAAGALP